MATLETFFAALPELEGGTKLIRRNGYPSEPWIVEIGYRFGEEFTHVVACEADFAFNMNMESFLRKLVSDLDEKLAASGKPTIFKCKSA